MYIPIGVIVAIVAIGFCMVIIPVAADTYRRFRGRRTVRCPETNTSAEIELDAAQAAITSVTTGKTDVQVVRCSHWPERENCGQACVAETEPTAASKRVA